MRIALTAPGVRTYLREAFVVCREPRTFGRTLRIAGVVGIILTGINEGDVIAEGRASGTTAVKIALNFAVPFVVSNLGVVAGRR
jgi:hypothetical protein